MALALVVAFVPRRRTVVEVAALGAAVLIALQISANYWLYSYIVWFFPLVAVALFAAHPERTSLPDLNIGAAPDVYAPASPKFAGVTPTRRSLAG